MRAALISIAGQPRRAGGQEYVALAGKTIARRQLDFALADGCDQIFVLGDGASAEAIALRHAAEAAGARFQAISTGHGLLGAVGATDELLVLAPGLLPESASALEELRHGNAVLVMAAGPAVAAGFERIDLERAWAGALVVRGRLVERLAELPPESEPASALLRIALQARLSERRLPEQHLADGTWSIVGDGDDSALREREWVKRHFPEVAPFAPAARVADLALRPAAVSLLSQPRAGLALVGGSAALLAGAAASAVVGWPAAAFVFVALGAVACEFGARFARLRDAPLRRRNTRGSRLLPLAVDLALTSCGILAIDGTLARRLFPPLVLLGLLHAKSGGQNASLLDLPRDRALLALILAVGAALGFTEQAIMLAALVLLVANVAQSAASRG